MIRNRWRRVFGLRPVSPLSSEDGQLVAWMLLKHLRAASGMATRSLA